MIAKVGQFICNALSVIVNSTGVELDGRMGLQVFYYLVNTRSLLLDIRDLMLGVATSSSSSSQKSCAIL
jgi:hypothetical protein